MRTILLSLFFVGCGTFKTVNNPYGKKQLLWGKTKTEDVYKFNNYWNVTKEFYDQYKIGDEFVLRKENLIK